MRIGLGLGIPFKKNYVAAIRSFNPSSLFANGEQGAWYDPSDMSTLFQDSAGTLPVTAVEQPVGLMLDKSKGLVLGPELVTNGDFSNGTTGWTPSNSTLTVVDGKIRVTNVGALNGQAYQSFATVVGKTYIYSVNSFTQTSTALPRIGTAIGGAQYGTGSLIFTATSATAFVSMRNGTAVDGAYADYDNISVRELPGNHAYQSTSASRPVLSARVNLLTKTEQFDDAVWLKNTGISSVSADVIAAPNGALTSDRLVEAAITDGHYVSRSITTSGTNVLSVYAKPNGRNWVRVLTSIANTACWFDIQNGALGTVGSAATASIEKAENGWWKLSVTFTGNAGTIYFSMENANNGVSYTGDGTSGIYIWGASLVPANQASLPYQRVNTATDYDTVGFKPYLKFDGIDDWLITPTITPGVDKAQVFAGVRKLSENGLIAETSVDSRANDGSFYLFTFTDNQYYFRSAGTVQQQVGSYAITPPITNTLTGLGNISGDLVTLRVNGAQVAQSTADQGTGNYLAYPLYIGRRGGTSLPFNGHIYSLIVRFGANLPAGTIASTESWVNGKTKAYV